MGRNPYGMTRPCSGCPFLRSGPDAVRLLRGRIREVAGNMLSSAGGEFPCHKTVVHDEDDGVANPGQTLHCAGALIFAEKNDNQTQMMRIAGRLRMYKPDLLTGHDEVFDDLDEMLASALDAPKTKGRKRS